jgi:hypothetical protein
MRLPHTSPARNGKTCVLTDVRNEVKWMWHGPSMEGALVAGDPLAALPLHTRTFASDLLHMSLSGSRDEATTRLLDTLKWFGDASFEESAGVQIVKWVAGLERLTGTERLEHGITKNFCKRVALLASGLGAGNVEKAFRDAFRAYDLRCEVMHGSRSQNDEHLSRNLTFVHELTREAIFGALSMHHLLCTRMKDGRKESMGRVYDQFTSKYSGLFETLYRELRPPKPRAAKHRSTQK